jgi:hypothetical protein
LRQEAVKSLKCAINTALEEAELRGEQIETLCISAPMEPGAVEEMLEKLYVRNAQRLIPGL